MARNTKQQAEKTRLHILDTAIRLFSQRGVSATSLSDIAQAAGVTRGAIYWHFKNKLDLFNEIWRFFEANISDIQNQYQAQFPENPLAVLREILIYVLEMSVRDERRRLMIEIMYHKCEYVGEMVSVRQAHHELCLEDYERIEHTLERCISAGLLPAGLQVHRAAIILRAYMTGLVENWLLAPESIDLAGDARTYINLLLEIYQFCPSLNDSSKLTGKTSPPG